MSEWEGTEIGDGGVSFIVLLFLAEAIWKNEAKGVSKVCTVVKASFLNRRARRQLQEHIWSVSSESAFQQETIRAAQC